MNSCRLCDNKPGRRFPGLVKYGVRHYTHTDCALKKWGAQFFDRLHTWQLEQLPYFAVKEAGLLPAYELVLQLRKHDFFFHDHGSVTVLQALTPAARAWVDDHLPADRQTLGAGTVIEPRYARAVLAGLQGDGLTVVLGAGA